MMNEEQELPDSAKLRRAVALFEETVRATFQLVKAGNAVRETRPTAGLIVYEFPPAPESIRLLLGDCFQNLRAALDHEVYAQSAVRHGKHWADTAGTAFPVHRSKTSFEQRGRKHINGLAPKAQAVVESVQPFHQPPNPIAELLVFVHDVARVDRHRLLQLAAVQPRSFEISHSTGQISLDVELRFVVSEFGGRDALGA